MAPAPHLQTHPRGSFCWVTPPWVPKTPLPPFVSLRLEVASTKLLQDTFWLLGSSITCATISFLWDLIFTVPSTENAPPHPMSAWLSGSLLKYHLLKNAFLN